jgi:threonine dehydrogenase-like Zn-dependent dehydrogenase
MRALWHYSHEESRLLSSVSNESGFDTVVRSLYSLISLGTETLVAKGLVPENLQQSMKVPYMEGRFSFPVKYGYSLVGTVVKSDSFQPGTVIHVMHPHQDRVEIEAKHAMVVPEQIPTKRAILVANMETVVNAVWDADLQQGQHVIIAGYGIIGSMLARICSSKFGCRVSILETDERKDEAIRQAGYQNAHSEKVTYDVAFNCSANELALQFCIDHVGEECAVIELSWYGIKAINIQLGGTFHSMRKKIISSQVSQIPKRKRAEWNYDNRKHLAFDFLKDDFFDSLLDFEIPFEDSARFFNTIRTEQSKGIGHFIKY